MAKQIKQVIKTTSEISAYSGFSSVLKKARNRRLGNEKLTTNFFIPLTASLLMNAVFSKNTPSA
jgi:hypothetical protein